MFPKKKNKKKKKKLTFFSFFPSSSLSQVMAYLNGNAVPRLLERKTLAVKWLGTLLSVASGVTLGLEAPLVHIGACVASLCADAAGRSWEVTYRATERVAEWRSGGGGGGERGQMQEQEQPLLALVRRRKTRERRDRRERKGRRQIPFFFPPLFFFSTSTSLPHQPRPPLP